MLGLFFSLSVVKSGLKFLELIFYLYAVNDGGYYAEFFLFVLLFNRFSIIFIVE